MRRERNLLVVLGCIAEKFAGPISSKLMSHEVQEYLYTFLVSNKIIKIEYILYRYSNRAGRVGGTYEYLDLRSEGRGFSDIFRDLNCLEM